MRIRSLAMKSAPALAAILALVSLPLHAQKQDELALIRAVRDMPPNRLDTSLPNAGAFDRYLATVIGVPIEALQWEVNDCGEGGDGRMAPTCVEVRAELTPDTTVAVSVSVLDINGKPGPPGLFMAYLNKGPGTTFAKSMRELLLLVGRTRFAATPAGDITN
jgi:hypothetical protein